MPPEKGYAFVEKATKQELEEKLFARWINGFQNVPFSEFKRSIVGADTKNQSEEEILEKVKNILSGKEEHNGNI